MERSPDIWYNDGTVVLEAESVLFRVYSGILSQHSSVFQSMFEMPQPQGSEEYEGCPLVHLQDSQYDLTCFLRVIHDYQYALSFHSTTGLEDFDTLAGILRLSTKYDIPNLRRRCVKRISVEFTAPSILGWGFTPHWLQYSWYPDYPGRCIAVVNLVRECNIPAVLPAALYICTRGSVELILNGASASPRISCAILSPADQRLCLLARPKLEIAARKPFSFLFTKHNNPTCTTPLQYHQIRLRLIAKHHDYLSWAIAPTQNLLDHESWKPALTNLCTSCHKEVSNQYSAGRGYVWDRLPQLFGLGDWTQCLKDEE